MNDVKELKCIIFDLGGVIVDLDWNKCVRSFDEIGILHMDQFISTTLQKDFILDFELGLISEDEFRAGLRQFATKEVTDEQINWAWNSLLVGILPKKLEMLKKLKTRYHICLLSNTNSISFGYCLQNMFNVNGHSIDDYFDKCYLSFQLHKAKPSPEIFEAVLKDLGMKPEECLFLDDAISNINQAEKFGLNVQLVKQNADFDYTFFEKLLNS